MFDIVVDVKNKSEAENLLNPFLVDLIGGLKEAEYKVYEVNARQLLHNKRFDLLAKYAYAKARHEGRKSGFHHDVYYEHLKVWSKGEFKEGDYSGKAGFNDYRKSFDDLIDDLAKNGFSYSKSIVPVDREGAIIDGSHRVGAAAALDLKVHVIVLNISGRHYDYEFFKNSLLDEKCLDYMALQAAYVKNNIYLACVFPSAFNGLDKIKSIISADSGVFYSKKISFSKNGLKNLFIQLYRNEPWIGDKSDGFRGAEYHIVSKMKQGNDVEFIWFEGSSLDEVLSLKEKVRGLFDVGNDSIHITDTKEEVVRLSRALLNQNGVHFINYSRAYQYDRFMRLFSEFKKSLEANPGSEEDYVVDTSAVLSAYGLRECNDLDYLYGVKALDVNNKYISPHNEELKYHHFTADELVYDPENYFWYENAKFLSLGCIRRMKSNRNEAKDKYDISLIDSVYRKQSILTKLYALLKYEVRVFPHKSKKILRCVVPKKMRPMIKKLYKKILNRLKRIKLLANRFGDSEKKIRYKGVDVYYSKGTSIIDRVLVDGAYEEEFSERLIEALLNKDSKYFLDIGANIGLISCNILDAVKGVKIYAFEPSPHAVRYLQKTISENQLDGSIDLNTCALSFENGEVEFAVHSAEHTSGNGIFDTGRSGETNTIKVKTLKLDDWWKTNGRPDIKVVKMDTEGAELWILRGSEEFVAQCEPVIFLEVHSDNIRPYPYEAKDYLHWAREHEYLLKTASGEKVDESNLDAMLELTQDYVLTPYE